MVGVFERVYEVGPVFRAEPHDTARHLAEYVSLDAEMGFIDDHRDVMAVLRDVLAGMVDAIAERAAAALDAARARAAGASRPRSRSVDFARRAADDRAPPPGGRPSASPTWLPPTSAGSATGRPREHGSELRVRHRLPDGEAALLHAPRPAPTRGSNSFDLLFRGLELVTGGQRLHRYEDYLAALAGHDLDAVRGLPRGVPPRHAAARRLRHRTRALGRPPHRRRQHPRGHPVSPRPPPPDAVTSDLTVQTQPVGAGRSCDDGPQSPSARRASNGILSRRTRAVMSGLPRASAVVM